MYEWMMEMLKTREDEDLNSFFVKEEYEHELVDEKEKLENELLNDCENESELPVPPNSPLKSSKSKLVSSLHEKKLDLENINRAINVWKSSDKNLDDFIELIYDLNFILETT